MWHRLCRDGRLYDFLLCLDADLALQAFGSGACPRCGGRLHQGHYLRKARGAPRDADLRCFSFCCGRDGCRGRLKPPSIRFLGRRVYLGVWVVLMSAMANGISEQRRQRLWVELGVDERTLRRWRRWWQRVLPMLPRWKALRADVMPPPDETALPLSLLSYFDVAPRSRAGPGAAVDVLRLLAQHPS